MSHLRLGHQHDSGRECSCDKDDEPPGAVALQPVLDHQQNVSSAAVQSRRHQRQTPSRLPRHRTVLLQEENPLQQEQGETNIWGGLESQCWVDVDFYVCGCDVHVFNTHLNNHQLDVNKHFATHPNFISKFLCLVLLKIFGFFIQIFVFYLNIWISAYLNFNPKFMCVPEFLCCHTNILNVLIKWTWIFGILIQFLN